jgi:hypothetical protein
LSTAHAALTEQLDAAVVAAIDAELDKHSESNAANALVALQRLAALRTQAAPPTTESTSDVVLSIQRLLAARASTRRRSCASPPSLSSRRC